jgi:hypothetical protein
MKNGQKVQKLTRMDMLGRFALCCPLICYGVPGGSRGTKLRRYQGGFCWVGNWRSCYYDGADASTYASYIHTNAMILV